MKALFRLEGPVYKIMTAIYRLMVLNLLWLFFSIPLVTIGASTTALYYVMGKIIRGEEVNEFSDFYKAFKMNWPQATVLWVILCSCYTILFINMRYAAVYMGYGSILFLIQFPILLQVIIISVLIFPLISRYEVTVLDAIKFSWIVGVKHFPSCLISMMSGLAVFLVARTFPVIFFFFFISLTAFCTYGSLNHVLEKYRPETLRS